MTTRQKRSWAWPAAGVVLLVLAAAGQNLPPGAEVAPSPMDPPDIGPGIAFSNTTTECLVCHSNQGFVVRTETGDTRSMGVDAERYNASVHGDIGCMGCHGDLGIGPHEAPKPEDLPEEFRDILMPRPSVEQAAIAACMHCHADVAQQFRHSIHARAAAAGSLDAPLCHDCHGYHYVDPARDIESAVNPRHVPATCAECHADETVMARYNQKTNVVQTYETSFHGQKRLLGEEEAAVCTSCHGVHDIRAIDDPQSRVNPANVTETCGECHQEATPEFSRSFMHRLPDRAEAPIVYWVSRFYTLMLYLTIGGMLMLIFLDVMRRVINKRRGIGHE